MDSIISLRQKNTLAEYMILFGADNHPPMLDKDLVAKGLWERVQLLMQGTSLTKHERECKLYDAFDKFTHIKGESLHTHPPEWGKFMTNVKLVKDLHTSNFDQLHAYLEPHELHANEVRFVVHVFSPGDDLIACLNKAMAFLTVVASSRVTMQQVQRRQGKSYYGTGYKSNVISSGGNNESGQARVVKCYNCQGEGHMARQCTQPKQPRNAARYKDKAMLAEAQEAGQILDEEQLVFLADLGVPDSQAVQTIIPNDAAFQTEDLDTYDSDCDDISNAKAVLMANISNYGSDVIAEVPHSETYLNDMENQSVHAMQDFEQTQVVDFTDNEIHSDSNIIPYSQYLQETQHANEKANKEQNNKSVTAELERYKERVKTFEQCLNIDLSSREKMIDSQMDDMIKEKLALIEQVDSLKQNLSKQIKEKECLLQTFTVFKRNIDFGRRESIKMSEKEKDPEVIKQNISHKPIDYEKLNRLSDDFGKRFTPQQELSAEQAFWLRMSNPTSKPSDASPVKIEDPKELDKIRTTPDARTEGEWGFKHTKAIFNNEIIPFLKSLKDIFNVLDKDLLNEIMEVHTVFNQIDVVQQFLDDKQCLEIAKKELLLENDRLLQQIMSQDVLLTVMNSLSLIGEYVNMDRKRIESCDKCFNLEAELLKSQNAHNDLLNKKFFKHMNLVIIKMLSKF
ncbi:integrase, catalytic region, zinc finger, CCHC-type containing protein [Tanacetum coccineum]